MHEYYLRYLPQFYHDLKHHVDYIANHLQNPQAANNLIDAAGKSNPRKTVRRRSV